MFTITAFAAVVAFAPDTVKLKSTPELEQNILNYTAHNDKGQRYLTEDILLVNSKSDFTGKPILLPKGSLWRSEAEVKEDFKLDELPTKQKPPQK